MTRSRAEYITQRQNVQRSSAPGRVRHITRAESSQLQSSWRSAEITSRGVVEKSISGGVIVGVQLASRLRARGVASVGVSWRSRAMEVSER